MRMNYEAAYCSYNRFGWRFTPLAWQVFAGARSQRLGDCVGASSQATRRVRWRIFPSRPAIEGTLAICSAARRL